MRVKRFNEELFGIGADNKNKRLITQITEAIFDNKDKVSKKGNIMSFNMKIESVGNVELKSPTEIIKFKEVSLKVNGKNIELSQSEATKLQTQLKNYAPVDKGSGEKVNAFFESDRVRTFEEFFDDRKLKTK